jgi:signal transduction histidine kinase/CheY-like chemotaxis protein
MTRFETATHPGVYWAIALTMAAVFIVDLNTPIGVATWMLYLVPMTLCFFVWRAWVPLVVAGTATLLLVLDWFFSAPGIAPSIALANRAMGLIVIWLVAMQARNIIGSRLTLRQQEWIQAARGALADCLSGEQTLPRLTSKVLDFTAQYLDAQAGAIYVVQEGGQFTRMAALALPTDTRQPASVQAGEGLLGRAIVERRAFELREIPTDYLKITSALGERQPHALLIAPLIADSEVQGAMELGFLHRTHQSDLELLRTLAEPMAIGIRTTLLRAEREKLLHETQSQAEELQSQQEELRVANEELLSQSNILRESQARLETQQAELEQTNVQLEEHSERLAQQNEALAEAKRDIDRKAAELTRSNQYKSEFLANMSHELRTPLNSALILSKLLADNRQENLTPEQVKFARSIYSAGNDLLELINDILDLSKIEARKVDIRNQHIEVQALLDGLTQTFRPMAEQKRIAFSIAVEPGVPATFESDSQRVRQVLKNLLSNAVKFTERGSVSLHVSSRGETLEFAVRDTGIGIPLEQHAVIFEPFRQADGTTNRKFGGTGLGLSISRELAHLLGGRIELQSTPGQGSTFRLIVPKVAPAAPPVREKPADAADRALRSPASAAVGAPESTASLAAERRGSVAPRTPGSPASLADDREAITNEGRILLVVEDDQNFARVLYDLSHELGFHCLIAPTAEEGMDLALQFRPAAIVLDMKLPDHSGLAVLDRLKRSAVTRHIPVQVISGVDHGRTPLEMGAAGTLLKPVPREALLDALKGLQERFSRDLRTVLVVEDDALQRDSVCQLLTSDSVRTVAVADAATALAELRKTTFDCMVLDLALPDSSGHELLEKMAASEAFAFPPVIVYTGRSVSADEEQQLRKYSKSIIIKGAKSPERLLDEVSLFLHQVEEKLPPDRQRMLREARARDEAFEGRRILVVEDDVRNIFALSSVLEPLGGEVVIARNGREALERLDGQPPVDLVLMDIMMPEMDGIQAMQEIRKRPGLKHLPIIALTAKAMPDDQQRCLAAGANDYITKPVDVDKLISLIRIWLPKD